MLYEPQTESTNDDEQKKGWVGKWRNIQKFCNNIKTNMNAFADFYIIIQKTHMREDRNVG